MALSKSVEDSLKEAESSLRNALAFAARQEKVMVCSVIADMISRIESLQSTDSILDKLENRKPGDSGFFGTFFNDEGEMKFYTNVQLIGNQVLVREVDNGVRKEYRDEFFPTLFVKSKKKTKFKTLGGEPVEPIKPNGA